MPRPKPSLATVRRARLRAKYIEERRAANYCEPVLISPNRVDYFYAGHTVRFEDKGEGVHHVYAGGQTFPYLNEEDFSFLRQEAEKLMKANRRGIAEAKARKAANTATASVPKPPVKRKRKKHFDERQTGFIL